ncbi:transglycosylase [Staphylococcus lugdunensis]|jgi:hypothetical protein|uniref:aggregation-promoting factor C-terminal-like domain-containing protein n=1 Tax=Staphylococcus lugdunensis TaxID=28035 RepID=UPI0004599E77|nr:hypothetical protein [Staphylococcus lugdunensis]KAK56075.1 hypothetical protein SLVCU150_2247 [Staphylococcus lugdunensis VCU150]MCI2845286.1 transglycosylase [Staphylococcus lugdunensis]MDU4769888.1 transglycosylase [Staphylococcus lugdunensis]
MRKSILAFIATVSIGAASAETYTHTAHANDLTNEQQKSTPPTTQSIQTTTSSPESDNDVDAVYDRFMAAGGTEELWEKIVLPESGANPHAKNGEYFGLAQTKLSWGYGTVEQQTRGMIEYAQSRYGSINAAVRFRTTHGWW